jgi:hypothetical protein
LTPADFDGKTRWPADRYDLSAYSGDLTIEGFNMALEAPDTNPWSGTGGLTSLTLRGCNCKNHRQLAQVAYENCNVSQAVPIKRMALRIDIDVLIEDELVKWWTATRDYVLSNPAATFSEYQTWFIANQGHTIFYSQTFLAAIGQELDATFASGAGWAGVRDWIVANADAEDFEQVVL